MGPTLQPLYNTRDANPAHHLRYSWTAWPSAVNCATCPSDLFSRLSDDFEQDGLHLLEHRWMRERVQLILNASPTVSPATLAQRVKDRLDQALRQANLSLSLSKEVAVQSLGEPRGDDVARFIHDQANHDQANHDQANHDQANHDQANHDRVSHEQVSRKPWVDSSWARQLNSYTVVNSEVDLVAPTASARGRYWYNLHLVLVTTGRHDITSVVQLCLLRDNCDKVAAERGYLISTLTVMPNHLQLSLRGNIEHSPVEIGRSFQNHLARSVGNDRLWMDGFYVSSFGESNRGPVQQRGQEDAVHRSAVPDGAVRREAGRDG